MPECAVTMKRNMHLGGGFAEFTSGYFIWRCTQEDVENVDRAMVKFIRFDIGPPSRAISFSAVECNKFPLII